MLIDHLRNKFYQRFGNLNLPKEDLDRMFQQFLWEEEQIERTRLILEAEKSGRGGEAAAASSGGGGGGGQAAPVDDTFITTWLTTRTATGSSNSSQISLPLVSNGEYDFTVDWGDNSTDTITAWDQAQKTHTYASPGSYILRINGTIVGWEFKGTGDRTKILTVERWGCLRFKNPDLVAAAGGFFSGCGYLSMPTVSDLPNFSGITSLRGMFRNGFASGVSKFFNRINEWDISGINDLALMFYDNPRFNQNVGNWDVSNVTNMSSMFQGLADGSIGDFNNGGSPDIGNWDTRNVTTMASMFRTCRSFNQNIGDWDVSNVTNMSYMFAGGTYSASSPSGSFNNGGSDSIRYWNTSSVINMSNMFLNQPSFQIRLDDWDVSKVTNMSYMFAGVGVYVYWNNGGTGQGYLGRWNTGNVTNMTYMFYNNVGFNRNIGEWNVSKVYDMTGMFQVFSPLKGIYDNEGYNTLSGPTGWNLSGLRRFPSMFAGSGDFNRPIGSWNVASVGLTGAGATQYFATNTGAQSHGNFMTGKVFATGATGFYSSANVDALLIGWASQSVLTARSISFGTAKRTAASNAAYTLLTGTVASGGKGWTITGAGL